MRKGIGTWPSEQTGKKKQKYEIAASNAARSCARKACLLFESYNVGQSAQEEQIWLNFLSVRG